ncbi:hypothetical protein DR64_8530 [Paraburkholderia xenovorans LB400]|uniref:Glycoside hydrolase, family 65 n=1 Tax=Paraburkholderia xenovorans (strain LB400) TaxID=266265 RepID=Q13FJ6_PARXL|nr:glycoside hydrolase family 65 protein [Paraburkholderia xenovorans]ABE37143.1 putative glycoside hydrolase, family 65 [Paraburkholderia xenovorans LB400]AIP34196.1 hypothetical protein DR64_8530 [Paraburkholderia xenovorans LB400]
MRDAASIVSSVVFDHYDEADERRRESLLGLGNGVLFVRACAPESMFASPADDGASHYPGTYRAGLYNELETEIQGERVRSTFTPRLPDATVLAVRPRGGRWLGADTSRVLDYRHALDMSRATATRHLLLADDGRTTRIEELRFVSAAHPQIIVLRWRVTACDWTGLLDIGAGIDGDVRNANVALQRAWRGRHVTDFSARQAAPETLLATARLSGALVWLALAARTVVRGAHGALAPSQLAACGAGLFELHRVPLQAGETVCIDRVIAVCTSRDATVSDPAEAVLALVSDEFAADADALQAAHERTWASRWERIQCRSSDARLARQLNLRAFHVAQTLSGAVVHEDAGFPARGWQEAYQGHIFWDDMFVLPALLRDCPEAARAPLLYRYRRLPAARRAAAREGYAGAMFPWRSATTGGEETPRFELNPLNGHWMRDDTRLQRHVGASIAWNIWRYYCMSGDAAFLYREGGEMLVEIARFWASIARFDEARRRYVIRAVIGPDEYHNAYPGADSPGLDNNAYTNVMAAWTLRCAADALRAMPRPQRDALAVKLELGDAEAARWNAIARRIHVPFLAGGIIEQFDGFSALKPYPDVSAQARHGQRTDWRLEAAGDTVEAWQVCKQPDVLMLFALLGQPQLASLLTDLGYPFDDANARRTLDYYTGRMTHESSLSKVACAAAFAHADPQRSWQYFVDALQVDAAAGAGSSAAEGLHLGALGGAFSVVLRHYAGIDFIPHAMRLFPAWPEPLPALQLAFAYRSNRFELQGDARTVRILSDPGNLSAVAVQHVGGTCQLAPGKTIAVAARAA